MREQLIQYVNLLFAGAMDTEDMKQEILQNTLDRYDDLLSQGKSPAAAYRLAISGIGDIHEILGSSEPAPLPDAASRTTAVQDGEDPQHRKYRAIAIAMYILSAVPLIILSEFGLDTLGLCLTLALVATATYILFLYKKSEPEVTVVQKPAAHKELKRSVGGVLWAITLAAYFLLSFSTHAWHITWLLFPIGGSIHGLANAIFDLMEAKKHEN